MFAVSADMCMILQKEIKRAKSLPAFRLMNFRMNGYVAYVAQVKKSFLLINKKLTLKETLENLGLVDSLRRRSPASLVS